MYEPPTPQVGAVQVLLLLSTVLLIVLVAYGIIEHDAELLDRILTLVREIVIAILSWAIGRYGAPPARPEGDQRQG